LASIRAGHGRKIVMEADLGDRAHPLN
jgi:hypothetical protein